MKFDRICSLVQSFYEPGNFKKADIDNADQFRHQMPVIIRAWESLANKGRAGVVLADEVGLGKTFEALGVIYFYLLHTLVESKNRQPRVLIILPSKLITKWETELERFGKQVDVLESRLGADEQNASGRIKQYLPYAEQIRIRGNSNSLHTGENRPLVKNEGIFLMTADRFVKLMGGRKGATESARRKFIGFVWDAVIIDEAHGYARGADGEGNQRSRSAKSFCKHAAENGAKIVLCTATPFQLDTSELVALLGLIELGEITRNKIAKAIETYNRSILLLQGLVEDSRPDIELQQSRLDASLAKEQLQLLLRPYVIRSRREGREARQYTIEAVSPQGPFPWVYWQVKDWARELARSDHGNMRTFLPTTLQMTLSSPATLEEHLRRWKRKYPRQSGTAMSLCKEILGKLGDLDHPKFESLRQLVLGRIDQVVAEFSGSLDGIAEHKCVVFVSHPATIQSLIGRTGSILDSAKKLDHSVCARTESILSNMHISPKDFRLVLRKEVHGAVKELLKQKNFDESGQIRIWETPYEKQTEDSSSDYAHLRGVEWGYREDWSGVRAKERKLRSLGEELTKNLSERLRGPLVEYDIVSKMIASDWHTDLVKIVSEIVRQRANKPLDDTQKWYFGKDNISDQPRERLRLRLSRIAYAFKPQEIIGNLSGDVDFAKRQQIIDAFNNDLYPLILLCTSVGEEGIDLQKRCNTVIHYDLEWNPAKVEQREGRVDRLGRDSKTPVRVNTYKLADTYDERILARCQDRKIWMELYLCKTWREEGSLVEEERLDHTAEKKARSNAPQWLKDYRLDLRPQEIEKS